MFFLAEDATGTQPHCSPLLREVATRSLSALTNLHLVPLRGVVASCPCWLSHHAVAHEAARPVRRVSSESTEAQVALDDLLPNGPVEKFPSSHCVMVSFGGTRLGRQRHFVIRPLRLPHHLDERSLASNKGCLRTLALSFAGPLPLQLDHGFLALAKRFRLLGLALPSGLPARPFLDHLSPTSGAPGFGVRQPSPHDREQLAPRALRSHTLLLLELALLLHVPCLVAHAGVIYLRQPSRVHCLKPSVRLQAYPPCPISLVHCRLGPLQAFVFWFVLLSLHHAHHLDSW